MEEKNIKLPKEKLQKKRGIIVIIMVSIAASFFLFPLFWMALTSIRPVTDLYKENPTFLPGAVTFDNYLYIFGQKDFGRYFLNSIVITICTVFLVLFSSILGGYAFGMKKFKGQNALFYTITLVLAIPYIMYLIPLYIIAFYLDLRNSWIGLIMPYVAINLPWGLLIMRGSFSTIPLDLRDAATIDGCGEFRFVFQILTPILKPSIAATTIITFIFAWEEFMFSSTINMQNFTLPVYFKYLLIATQGQEWGRVGAVITVTIIPVIILFIIFRKFFVKGLSKGMLKG